MSPAKERAERQRLPKHCLEYLSDVLKCEMIDMRFLGSSNSRNYGEGENHGDIQYLI